MSENAAKKLQKSRDFSIKSARLRWRWYFILFACFSSSKNSKIKLCKARICHDDSGASLLIRVRTVELHCFQISNLHEIIVKLFIFGFIYVKFVFSKKATKIDKILTVDLMVTTFCQIDGEDFVNFCGLFRKREL